MKDKFLYKLYFRFKFFLYEQQLNGYPIIDIIQNLYDLISYFIETFI